MKNCAALSRNYRVVWSRARGIWVAVSELVGSPGKGSAGRRKHPLRGLLLLIPFSLFSSLALAAPQGGQVTAGSGAITHSGSTTTIHQSSQNLSLSWKSFNVAPTETVNFKQPNASALAVNRIHDTNGSRIMGHLNANGQVWLINPNGVLFGKGAQVNVGGLIASTLDTADGTIFSGSGKGSVVNEGTINAAKYVALLGNSVTNSGIITARLGTVALGAGNVVSLTFSGNSLVKLQVNRSVVDSLVANHGLVKADGGMVVMNAGARDTLLASVVNNDGVIEAQTVQNHNGTIKLLGGMKGGMVNVGGTLDASAPASLNQGGGNGGFIETSAAHVKVANNAKITTLASNGANGTWLIDPQDYTIAASGGDMTGTALTNSLATTSVTIQSSHGGTAGSGNINVDDAVSWSANLLALTAAKDININAVMSATGSASLALNPATANGADAAVGGGTVNVGMDSSGSFTGRVDFSGSGTLSIGNIAYTVLGAGDLGTAGDTTTSTLQGMKNNPAGYYALGADINAGSSSNNTSGWNGGKGFTPVGSSASTQFTGVFDGLGHTISGLTINPGMGQLDPLTLTFSMGTAVAGLFGNSAGTIRNVGVVNAAVTGGDYVGGLVGYNTGTISSSYATGTVHGIGYVGGLVGHNSGTISKAYATSSVSDGLGTGFGAQLSSFALASLSSMYSIVTPISGSTGSVKPPIAIGFTGGLVGANTGAISKAYATGNISGSYLYVGGLLGYNTGTINSSHATGSVNGMANLGGMVGYNTGAISNGYATGSVRSWAGGSGDFVGGLAGDNGGTINNAYAAGSVTGTTSIGGLVGRNRNGGTISNGYATGNVLSAGSNGGGLAGYNGGAIDNAYATGSVTGIMHVGGLVGSNVNSGTISTAYATGNVKGLYQFVGGLTGDNSGSITDAYATGNVSSPFSVNYGSVSGANSYVGGLTGDNSGRITAVYATGSVDGSSNVGGLAGADSGVISGGYWDSTTDTSTAANNGTGTGLTTAQLASALPSGFSGSVWGNVGNQTTPYLKANAGFSTVSGAVYLGSDTSATPTAWGVILTATQLQNINSTGLSGHYVLGGNIDATATSGWNGGKGFMPIGTGTNANTEFTGIFDGLNHTISNLTIHPGTAFAALFGTSAGTIRNVGVVNASVTGLNDSGALVGYNPGTISNSYAGGGSVNGGSGSFVGGLAGNNTGTISNSYATDGVTGGSDVGGLTGQNFGGSISDSYATGGVTGSGDRVGGLLGYNTGAVTNIYAAGSVTGGAGAGGLVGSNNGGTVSNGYWDKATTGQTTSSGSASGNGLTTAQLAAALPSGFSGSVWADGGGQTTPYLLAGDGFGVAGSVYLGSDTSATPTAYGVIQTLTELQNITTTGLSGKYVLGTNLDASATSGWNGGKGFTPIGTGVSANTEFTGIFDGLNHTISNLTIKSGTAFAGLFGTSAGTIRNVGVVNASVTGTNDTGALVGYNPGTISNSYAGGGSVNGGSGLFVGGLAGNNPGTISNSHATDSVTGGSYVGDLTGQNVGGTISNSYATGSVTGSGNVVGSLVGYNTGTISRVYATGSVTGGKDAGGLTGENDGGTVSYGYATGSVKGTTNVGGLVGYNTGTISNVYATGSVSGTSNVGGLVGDNASNGLSTVFGSIADAYATGTVSGTSHVGGLVGVNHVFVTDGYWDITTSKTSIGIGLNTFTLDTATGLTTSNLAANLPSGFSTSVWGNGGNQTTPYLLANDGFAVSGEVYLGTDSSATPIAYGVIRTLTELQGINTTGLSGNYVLGTNLDASATSGWNSGAGFSPIGTSGSSPFSGTFNGLYHIISGLTINRASANYVGLFGYASGTVKDVGLEGGSVHGLNWVGALAGATTGTVTGAYASTTVSGRFDVGGLVGLSTNGTVDNSYATGSVSGSNINIGGLVGGNVGAITNAYATGSVTGSSSNVGGLVGVNWTGRAITNAYATGRVSGGGSVGGLVGSNHGGSIGNGYYDSTTTGQSDTGKGTGMTTSNLAASLPIGFSSSVWGNVGGQVTPYLKANASFSTVSGNVILGSDNSATPTVYGVILDMTQLQNINSTGLSGNYVLGTNLDASATSGWNGGKGFTPVGTGTGVSTEFTGVFDGLNHTVSNLTIKPGSAFAGLFGTSAGALRNVGVVNATVAGTNDTGALVGYNTGSISNSYASGGSVDGGSGSYVGGLAGNNTGTISGSYATDSVSAGSNVGGLMGQNVGGTVSDSYATGSVTGSARGGGLLGFNTSNGTVSRSYATGGVTLTGIDAGGLVGWNNAVISDSYATGALKGADYTGGLAGYNSGPGSISDSYAAGSVSATSGSHAGGLVGYNQGAISKGYWDTSVTATGIGLGSTAGANGKTTAQMQNMATFSGWSIAGSGGAGKSWRIYDGKSYPLLEHFLTPLTVTANNASKTYDGLAYDGSGGVSYSVAPNITLLGSVSYSAGSNAGSQTITPSGLYSTSNQGYDASYATGTLTVNKADLALSGSRIYDGSTTVAGSALTATGVNGETFSVMGSGDATNLASKDVQTGSQLASVTGLLLGSSSNGGRASNYNALTTNGSSVTVTPKALTVSGLSVTGKTYDGTTGASLKLTSASLKKSEGVGSGSTNDGTLYTGDSVSISQTSTVTGTFATANAGTNIQVTNLSGLSLSGTQAKDYSVTSPAGLTANISQKSVLVTGESASNKRYDGTTGATLKGGSLSGVLAVDATNVSLNESGNFATKNVGNGIVVTGGDTLSGTAAGNYKLTQTTALKANITPATLTLSAVTDSKTYDGTTASGVTVGVQVTGKVGSGLYSGDTITGLSQSFAGKDALGSGGSQLQVDSGYTISDGNGGGNYAVTMKTAAGTITPKSLTVSGLSATGKTYDGTTSASLTLISASLKSAESVGSGSTNDGTAYSIDTVSISQTSTVTGKFATANAGKNIQVTNLSGLKLSGAQASDYSISSPAGLTANIVSKGVTVTGEGASNKVYDGTTAATLSGGALSGVLAADAANVSLSESGSFATKNVGSGIAVTAADTLSGTASGNYRLTQPMGLTANIVAKAVMVTGEGASNKVYDGTVVATLSGGALSGVLAADAANVSLSESGSFTTKNVGSGIAVTAADTLSGMASGNYRLTQPTGLTANITAKGLTISGITASNKVYDGGTAATVNTTGATYTGLLKGDTVTVGATGAFADKNVGNSKMVSLTSSYSGADVGNYTITDQAATMANITPKALTVSGITAANKVYDGGTAATVNTTGAIYTGLVNGDTVTVGATGTFADKNVGNGKTVSLSSSYNGADVGNYSITDQSGTTANITPKGLTIGGITVSNKIYDGGTAATVNSTGAIYTGLVNGDAVGVSTTGTFADKNVGNGKTVSLSSSYNGADVGNYSITDQASTIANITPKGLTIGGITASNKIYDGTTSATMNTAGATYTGLVSGDAVTVGVTGSFSDKNVGTGKTVSLTSQYSGVDVGNYSITDQATATADITPATLTYTAIPAVSLVGTALPPGLLTGRVTGFVNGETQATATTGTLSWSTTATTSSIAGSYPIDGGGLTALHGNYKFVQDGGNANSLSLEGNTSAMVNYVTLSQPSVNSTALQTDISNLTGSSGSTTGSSGRSTNLSQVQMIIYLGNSTTIQVLSGGILLPDSL